MGVLKAPTQFVVKAIRKLNLRKARHKEIYM